MQRINNWTFIIVACLVSIFCLSGCDSSLNKNDDTEVIMENYYIIEDFQSITIGESTYRDVCKVATTESMQITSYGGFCEYPMQNGGCIRIKFYGKDLTVGAMEEISPLAED